VRDLRIWACLLRHEWYDSQLDISKANDEIQGIGGGGMIALVEVTVTDMVGLNERGAFAGIVAMAWAMGTVLGPIIGGAIAEKTTWRW
jgi:MFS family permease